MQTHISDLLNFTTLNSFNNLLAQQNNPGRFMQLISHELNREGEINLYIHLHDLVKSKEQSISISFNSLKEAFGCNRELKYIHFNSLYLQSAMTKINDLLKSNIKVIPEQENTPVANVIFSID